MVQIIEQPGSTGQRVLGGLAQGFANQLPKEVDRYRLSSGLKNLGQQDFTGKNQFEVLGQLANIPGMTPDLMQTALQQIQKQNFRNRTPGQTTNVPGVGTPGVPQSQNVQGQPAQPEKPAQTVVNVNPKLKESGFASPSQITEYKQSIKQQATPAQKKALADSYIDDGITQDYGQALALAGQELAETRAAEQQRIKELRSDLSNRVSLGLQGAGLGDYKDVPGEIQKSLVDQGEVMVANGMTPEAASERLDQIMTELGKDVTTLKELGYRSNWFRSAEKKSTDLRELKKSFDKYGYGEHFNNMAAHAMGISRLQAAHVLEPLKNKTILDEIGSMKKRSRGLDFAGGELGQLSNDQLEKLGRNIKPTDNLFSIEYLLRDKGYDVNQFKKKVSDLRDKKFIALTDEQKEQLKKPIDNTFFGDLLFQAF